MHAQTSAACNAAASTVNRHGPNWWRAYGADATFVIDRKGVIRGIWRKVKVPGHVAAVLQATKAL